MSPIPNISESLGRFVGVVLWLVIIVGDMNGIVNAGATFYNRVTVTPPAGGTSYAAVALAEDRTTMITSTRDVNGSYLLSAQNCSRYPCAVTQTWSVPFYTQSIALSSATGLLAIGSTDNAVHIYACNTTAPPPCAYSYRETIQKSLDYYGTSVAVDGWALFVGSPATRGSSSGVPYPAKVFIYDCESAPCAESTTLVGPSDRDFARQVLVDAGTVVVSTYRNDPIAGQAFVYKNCSMSGNCFLFSVLMASDASAYDYFGNDGSIAIENDIIVVGALRDGRTGQAYVFDCSGPTCLQTDLLTPNDRLNNDWFGASVALHSGVVVIGSPFPRLQVQPKLTVFSVQL